MTDGDRVFIDTNVLAHALVAESPWHSRARLALKKYSEQKTHLWISRQVIREYVAVMSRPQTFSSPLTREQLVDRIRYFEAKFRVAEEGPSVTKYLADLILSRDFGGRQVHDANIVATMQAYAIPCLVTFNVVDFKRFGDIVQIVEP